MAQPEAPPVNVESLMTTQQRVLSPACPQGGAFESRLIYIRHEEEGDYRELVSCGFTLMDSLTKGPLRGWYADLIEKSVERAWPIMKVLEFNNVWVSPSLPNVSLPSVSHITLRLGDPHIAPTRAHVELTLPIGIMVISTLYYCGPPLPKNEHYGVLLYPHKTASDSMEMDRFCRRPGPTVRYASLDRRPEVQVPLDHVGVKFLGSLAVEAEDVFALCHLEERKESKSIHVVREVHGPVLNVPRGARFKEIPPPQPREALTDYNIFSYLSRIFPPLRAAGDTCPCGDGMVDMLLEPCYHTFCSACCAVMLNSPQRECFFCKKRVEEVVRI